ncbi:MAG: lytic transglycosylase domain-containing protein [Candidatus Kapaibacterium sp.]|jgi:membrane-bound lytic murein transglycosylase D
MKLSDSFQLFCAVLVLVVPALMSCNDQRADLRSSSNKHTALPLGASAAQADLPVQMQLFGESIPLHNAEVKERCERELYVNLQTAGQLALNIKRSARYFELFSKLAKDNGVPDDIKYLAVAESALFMTRSQKDAVGLWQFMEPTARSYGLRVDAYVDERKHVEKSTRAALRYMKDAYRMFGSWILAAAAYNMGMEGVRSSMESQGTVDYFSTYFNDETSRYVPRIAVIKELMEHSEQYGIVVPENKRYNNSLTRVVIESNSVSNLAAWALKRGVSYKDVKLLNPWILGSSLPHPHGRWEIVIPE